MRRFRLILALTIVACTTVFAACGGRAYVYDAVDQPSLRDRAETKTEASIRVSATVPGRDETKSVFGIDLYAQGIQPVWLEIQNSDSALVRYAVVSTDADYFSPLEVAYKNKGGYSGDGRSDMEKRFNQLAMPRYVDPGETRSGFVFTHADDGAKGFNVDVMGTNVMARFTFLLRVPDFTPDYANFDAASIYAADEVVSFNSEQIAIQIAKVDLLAIGYGSAPDPTLRAGQERILACGRIHLKYLGSE